MPRYKITTQESVQGSYIVEADDDADARKRFSGGHTFIDFGVVDQIDYMAYDVDIERVDEISS